MCLFFIDCKYNIVHCNIQAQCRIYIKPCRMAYWPVFARNCRVLAQLLHEVQAASVQAASVQAASAGAKPKSGYLLALADTHITLASTGGKIVCQYRRTRSAAIVSSNCQQQLSAAIVSSNCQQQLSAAIVSSNCQQQLSVLIIKSVGIISLVSLCVTEKCPAIVCVCLVRFGWFGKKRL